MQIIKKRDGNTDLIKSLATMDINETWDVTDEGFSVGYLRSRCSVFSSVTDKFFAVHAPRKNEDNESVTITRVV